MILGIGTDIVSLNRLRKISSRYGTRFVNRILTSGEIAILPEKNRDAFLAGRFAAKEAVIKALGTRNTGPAHIEIINDENGRPFVSNSGMLLEKTGFSNARLHVSISHERDYAVGMAIIEKD